MVFLGNPCKLFTKKKPVELWLLVDFSEKLRPQRCSAIDFNLICYCRHLDSRYMEKVIPKFSRTLGNFLAVFSCNIFWRALVFVEFERELCSLLVKNRELMGV